MDSLQNPSASPLQERHRTPPLELHNTLLLPRTSPPSTTKIYPILHHFPRSPTLHHTPLNPHLHHSSHSSPQLSATSTSPSPKTQPASTPPSPRPTPPRHQAATSTGSSTELLHPPPSRARAPSLFFPSGTTPINQRRQHLPRPSPSLHTILTTGAPPTASSQGPSTINPTAGRNRKLRRSLPHLLPLTATLSATPAQAPHLPATTPLHLLHTTAIIHLLPAASRLPNPDTIFGNIPAIRCPLEVLPRPPDHRSKPRRRPRAQPPPRLASLRRHLLSPPSTSHPLPKPPQPPSPSPAPAAPPSRPPLLFLPPSSTTPAVSLSIAADPPSRRLLPSHGHIANPPPRQQVYPPHLCKPISVTYWFRSLWDDGAGSVRVTG